MSFENFSKDGGWAWEVPIAPTTAGGAHSCLFPECEFVSIGYFYGYFYEVDGYPGAAESIEKDQTKKVYG